MKVTDERTSELINILIQFPEVFCIRLDILSLSFFSFLLSYSFGNLKRNICGVLSSFESEKPSTAQEISNELKRVYLQSSLSPELLNTRLRCDVTFRNVNCLHNEMCKYLHRLLNIACVSTSSKCFALVVQSAAFGCDKKPAICRVNLLCDRILTFAQIC